MKPKHVYLQHPTYPETVIAVERGVSGYFHVAQCTDAARAGELARNLNLINKFDPTREESEAYLAGSMFGWNVPAAKLAQEES